MATAADFSLGECATGAQQCSKALRDDHNPQRCTRPVELPINFPVGNFVYRFLLRNFCLFLLSKSPQIHVDIKLYIAYHIVFSSVIVSLLVSVILYRARSNTRQPTVCHLSYHVKDRIYHRVRDPPSRARYVFVLNRTK